VGGGGARFSTPVQTDPGGHPVSYRNVFGSFPGVKWPGRCVNHPPRSSAEVRERVELYFCSPLGLSWPALGCTLPLFNFYIHTNIRDNKITRQLAGDV
jgi:hypothetical protein